MRRGGEHACGVVGNMQARDLKTEPGRNLLREGLTSLKPRATIEKFSNKKFGVWGALIA